MDERNPEDGQYSSRYLSRNRVVSWDAPSYTILTSPRDTPIHPGDGTVTMEDVRNHRPRELFYPNHDRLPVSAFRSYKFDASNRGAKWGEPSVTLRANTVSGQPWHPDKYEVGMVPRRFTVRECLRIQSAPDWYVLPDDISLSAQYRIVGNGVPCRVAWYLGRALADQLKEVRRRGPGSSL